MRYRGVKGRAWETIKQIVRIKGKGKCYTCPRSNLEGINAQSGHCWPVAIVGSNNTLSWDLRQIKLQCSRCNGPGQGMQAIFKANLVRELGAKEIKDLEARVYKVDKVKNWDVLYYEIQSVLHDLL